MKISLGKSLLVILLFLSFPALNSQVLSKKEFVKAVEQADISFYYDEDYEVAAAKYESLLKQFPQNHNLESKLGICYLNIDGKKGEALKLLISGARFIVKNDIEYTEFGEKAALDTYLYLAVAYHQNDSLEKAIIVYTDAKKHLGNLELFRNDYIDNQIRNCKYAIEMKKNPQPVTSTLFNKWLAGYQGASNPVLSKNDSVFLFSVKNGDKIRIYCSYKNREWKKPTDITKQLGAYVNSFPNSITADGKMLIIYSNYGGEGDLFYSLRKDSTWSKVRSLGKNINSVYWEAHGSITPDGKTIYFSSNKPGGKGELDIWKSDRDAKGDWGSAVNCGNTVNTPYNENTPFFDDANNTLYFSSVGHLGMGSYDVFRSAYKNGNWSKPLGIPYLFNSTLENSFFITSNNSQGFITSLYDEKSRSRNIYTLSSEEPADKKIYAFGNVVLNDGLPVNPDQTEIKLFDLKTGVLLKTIELNEKGTFNFDVKPGDFRIMITPIGKKPDTLSRNYSNEKQALKKQLADTGTFIFEVRPGDYQLHVSHTGYKTDTLNLSIPMKLSGNYIQVTSDLVPMKVAEGKFLKIKNILFGYNSFELTETAVSVINELRSILLNYPELIIEVAGYTDSRGSKEYNLKLADKRAQVIIDRLINDGIAQSRMVKKAFGSSEFAARNTNADGSDNPEGRKYNRRATFGIINSKTGIVIRQETYTPINLRHSNSMKYCIVLEASNKKLAPGYFEKMKTSETLFISEIPVKSITYYILGDFYNRSEALSYINYAKENGFSKAYVADRYEMAADSGTILELETVKATLPTGKLYTIQISASREKLDINKFKGMSSVKETFSSDGYYRYTTGEYSSFSQAKSALPDVQNKGFKNAFIRDINTLSKN